MKTYTQHILEVKQFVKRPDLNRRLSYGIEQAVITTVDDVFDEPVTIDNTVEWELVGTQIPTHIDDDVVEQLQENLNLDPLSLEIKDGEQLVNNAQNQMRVLQAVKDSAVDEWETHGNISTEISKIDAAVERRLKQLPEHQRSLQVCLEAVEEQISDLRVSKVYVQSTVVVRLIDSITKKLGRYKKQLDTTIATISELQSKRLTVHKSPDYVLTSKDIDTLTNGSIVNAVTDIKEGMQLRTLSDLFVSKLVSNISQPLLAQTLEDPKYLISMVNGINDSIGSFNGNKPLVETFLTGLEQVLKGVFNGNWTVFKSPPFIKDFKPCKYVEDSTNQTGISISTIEQLEKLTDLFARSLSKILTDKTNRLTSQLNQIKTIYVDVPAQLTAASKDTTIKVEHLVYLMYSYIKELSDLVDNIDELNFIMSQLTYIVKAHDNMLDTL